jgi:hypothetical protein
MLSVSDGVTCTYLQQIPRFDRDWLQRIARPLARPRREHLHVGGHGRQPVRPLMITGRDSSFERDRPSQSTRFFCFK